MGSLILFRALTPMANVRSRAHFSQLLHQIYKLAIGNKGMLTGIILMMLFIAPMSYGQTTYSFDDNIGSFAPFAPFPVTGATGASDLFVFTSTGTGSGSLSNFGGEITVAVVGGDPSDYSHSVVLNDGSAFDLQSLTLENSFGFVGDYFVTGLKDGLPVTGAVATGAMPANFSSIIVDLSAVDSFNNVDQFNVTFSGTLGSAWSFQDITVGPPVVSNPFITTWSIPGDDLELTLRLEGTGFSIDWGDGTVDSNLTQTLQNISHTYSTAGVYSVNISTGLDRIEMNSSNDAEDLLTIEQWGGIIWKQMGSAFSNCSNLTLTATDIPDFSQLENISFMFRNATSFNQDISNWDVSNIKFMQGVFQGATSFDQDISEWDVSSVTSMQQLFFNASTFNQNIESWDVSSVVNMGGIFSSASSFDQPLNGWDMGNVTNLNQMFRNASTFNQDLNDWDVTSAVGMSSMFQNAVAFNGVIGDWDVSNTSQFSGMFLGATSFNKDISSWNTGNATSMFQMFSGAVVFNQNIGSWDVSGITNLFDMFRNAASFNQDINNWDVSNVTNMVNMFREANAFNQNLGGWNVGLVANMTDMFSNNSMSTENYDSTLIGWAGLPSLQTNVNFTAADLTYCLGTEARQSIIDTYGWTIVGDSKTCPLVFTNSNSTTYLENSTAVVLDVNANVGDGDDIGVSYSLAATNDAALFNISSTSGELTFISSPDFEAPADSDMNNVYLVEVIATSGSVSGNQSITITVTDEFENIEPIFTSTPVITVNDNELYNYTITTADANSDNTIVSAVTLPAWLGLNTVTGSNTITIAGTGGADFINGNGTSAAFAFPAGVAVDNSGNIFVADQDNHVIRRITPLGDVSTFCGSGVQGFVDGNANTARFDNPKDLAFDGSGNLLVADLSNNRIRRIAPDGTVTTLAGSGAAGFVNGNGTSAVFRFPAGIAVDGNDNVFVADQDNHVIRQITPSGDVSTFAGSGIEGFADGAAGVARFDDPKDLAFDNSGNLYVADFQNNRIRKISPSGDVSTLAGSGAAGFINGNGTSAVFNFPAGVAVDAFGNVCVADQDNHVIRLIAPNGDVTTFAGSGVEGFADGDAATARFDDPKDLTFDNAGNLYVADFENNRIRKLASSGAVLQGDPSGQPSGDYPVVLKVSDGNGGESLQSFTVTIIDATTPVVITQDLILELDENGSATVTGELVDNGSADTNGIQSFDLSQSNFDCSDVGVVEVTLVVTDNNGLTASALANIEVQDNLSPVLTIVGDDIIQLNLNDSYDELSATASDNCSAVLTIGGDVVNTGVLGTYLVTYDAIDPSGNTAVQLIRTLNVVDNTAPEIMVNDIVANNENGVCGATIFNYGASATDNSGSLILSFNLPEGSFFPVGNSQVTVTAIDQSGNSSQSTFNVTVNDVESPLLTLIGDADVTIELGDSFVDQGVILEDNCSAIVTVAGDIVNTSIAGPYVITYDAADPSGNAASQLLRTVNVVDTVDPIITVDNINTDNEPGLCGSIVSSYGIVTSDNSGNVTLNLDVAEGSFFSVGTTVVTAIATDASGNSSQVSFNVTVNDIEAPLITLLGDEVINLNLNDTYTELGATVNDNCSGTLTISGDVVDTNLAGTYIINYDAVDPSGNTALRLTRTVNVIDLTPIDISLVAAVVNSKLETNITCAGGMDGTIDASVTGGTQPFVYSWSNGASTEDVTDLAAGTYTLTVTDANGQSASESITLTAPSVISTNVKMFPEKPLGRYGQVHTIYRGLGPQIVWLKAFTQGGNGWYRYHWSGSDIKFRWGQLAIVAPKETTTYEVLVTDKKGCTSIETFTVRVIDIRCNHKIEGKKNRNNKKWRSDKVHVCHNGKNLCVSANAAWMHLKHGDSLGQCPVLTAKATQSDFDEVDNNVLEISEPKLKLEAYPNPATDNTNIVFSSELSGPASVSIINSSGILMHQVFDGQIDAGKKIELIYNTRALPSGIYIVRMVTPGGIRNLKLMVKK